MRFRWAQNCCTRNAGRVVNDSASPAAVLDATIAQGTWQGESTESMERPVYLVFGSHCGCRCAVVLFCRRLVQLWILRFFFLNAGGGLTVGVGCLGSL